MNKRFSLAVILSLCTLLFHSALWAKPMVDSRSDKVLVIQEVNGSADRVWSIMSTLDGVEQIVPHMIKSTKVVGEGKGALRICTDHEGNEFHERILAFDDHSRSFTYTLEQGPMPLKHLYNTFQVLPLGADKSLLVVSSKFDIPPTMQNGQGMVEMMNGMLGMAAKGIKALAEK